jgi:hypothetical protein
VTIEREGGRAVPHTFLLTLFSTKGRRVLGTKLSIMLLVYWQLALESWKRGQYVPLKNW